MTTPTRGDILERNGITRLDWRTLIRANPDTAPDILQALDAYFEPFAQPPGKSGDDGKFTVEEGHPCLRCGKPLSGLLGICLGGGFEWGIAHGEGRCSACKWPARVYHFIKDANGESIMTVRGFLLQYHPDFVDDRTKKRERDGPVEWPAEHGQFGVGA